MYDILLDIQLIKARRPPGWIPCSGQFDCLLPLYKKEVYL